MKPLVPLFLLAPFSAMSSITTTSSSFKVPLEIHIMSQCPDATYAFNHLVSPALEQISALVEYTQSFIGAPASAGGVSCKHGADECLGNMLHLCAASLTAPSLDYLVFSRCLLDDYKRVTDQEFVKACAGKAGIDFEKLNYCVSDVGEGGGLDLLLKSVQRSAEVGARTSCTVRVEGKTVCVRDGGEWRDCPEGHEVADLVRLVKEAYRRRQGKEGLVGTFEEMRSAGKIDWMDL